MSIGGREIYIWLQNLYILKYNVTPERGPPRINAYLSMSMSMSMSMSDEHVEYLCIDPTQFGEMCREVAQQ
jgi:hypothetical protein